MWHSPFSISSRSYVAARAPTQQILAQNALVKYESTQVCLSNIWVPTRKKITVTPAWSPWWAYFYTSCKIKGRDVWVCLRLVRILRLKDITLTCGTQIVCLCEPLLATLITLTWAGWRQLDHRLSGWRCWLWTSPSRVPTGSVVIPGILGTIHSLSRVSWASNTRPQNPSTISFCSTASD